MNIVSNEKINFKSLEENIFKEMMKLGRKLIQEELRLIDKLILDYRDKEIFKPKDFQPTTIKTKLGEIPIARRYNMYCVCRDRMKKNRTSWSVIGAEALLKVIMNKMNGTIKEIITKKAERKIKEELSQRIPEPQKETKQKYEEIRYVGTARILENINRDYTKENIRNILKPKKCSELMLIN